MSQPGTNQPTDLGKLSEASDSCGYLRQLDVSSNQMCETTKCNNLVFGEQGREKSK